MSFSRFWVLAVPVTWWRSVYNSQHAFVNECFLDEMAHAAGVDPLQFRLDLLPAQSRLRGVLQLAAATSDWGKPMPAIRGEITVEKGRIVQSNFDSYEPLRINEAPAIEVHIAESHQPPGGVGEPGIQSAAPALCNAIFAATGIRVRRLPLSSLSLQLRME